MSDYPKPTREGVRTIMQAYAREWFDNKYGGKMGPESDDVVLFDMLVDLADAYVATFDASFESAMEAMMLGLKENLEIMNNEADHYIAMKMEEVDEAELKAPKFYKSNELLMEAAGWLKDCGLPIPDTGYAIKLAIDKHYEGGWTAFVDNSIAVAFGRKPTEEDFPF